MKLYERQRFSRTLKIGSSGDVTVIEYLNDCGSGIFSTSVVVTGHGLSASATERGRSEIGIYSDDTEKQSKKAEYIKTILRMEMKLTDDGLVKETYNLLESLIGERRYFEN